MIQKLEKGREKRVGEEREGTPTGPGFPSLASLPAPAPLRSPHPSTVFESSEGTKPTGPEKNKERV